ncbi:MAG: type II toxin-antitoxin system VapC family toxin [Rhodomicrobium sp.]
MGVDTSALVAILNREPERESFLLAIEEAGRCYISALSLYETQLVVLARLGERGMIELEELIGEFGFSVVLFDRAQADLCVAAYRRFGKGFGSAASLNLCDCAAYALAQSLSLPLLYKGNDFAATDVMAVR